MLEFKGKIGKDMKKALITGITGGGLAILDWVCWSIFSLRVQPSGLVLVPKQVLN